MRLWYTAENIASSELETLSVEELYCAQFPVNHSVHMLIAWSVSDPWDNKGTSQHLVTVET